MPGVTVSLIHTATGTRQTISLQIARVNSCSPQVDAGAYTLEASMPGFVGYQANFTLQPATQFRQDITLQLAAGPGPPVVCGQCPGGTQQVPSRLSRPTCPERFPINPAPEFRELR